MMNQKQKFCLLTSFFVVQFIIPNFYPPYGGQDS